MNNKETPEMELLIAVFRNEEAAKEALSIIKAVKQKDAQAVQGGVALRMNVEGSIHHEDIGLTPAKGVVGGVVLGVVVGWMTGGLGLVLGALGGVVGSMFGRKEEDKHVPTAFYNWAASKMEPSHSALVAVVALPVATTLINELSQADVDIYKAVLTDELLTQMQDHEQAAYEILDKSLDSKD